MKILLVFLFLTNFYELSSQSVYNNGRTNIYSGKGTIDNNLSITFELDAIDRPYYDDHCYIGFISQFIGRYYYDKFEQFKGLIIGNKFNGIRSENNKNLSFSITLDSNKFTELYVSTPKGIFTLPIDHGNKFNQNEFEVINIQEYENKTFVLLKLNLTQCLALNCRGAGCGGTNLYLRLYEIQDGSYKIHESILDGYGMDGKHRDKIEEEIGVDFYRAKIRQYNNEHSETYYNVHVNFVEIYKGIKEIKL